MRAATTIISALKEKNVAAGEEFRTLRSEFDHACEHLRNLQAQADGMREQERNAATGEQLDVLRAQSAHMGEHLRNAQAELDGMTGLRSDFDGAGEHLRNLQAQVDGVIELRNDLSRAGEHLKNLQVASERMREGLNNLQQRMELRAQQDRHLEQQLQAEIGKRGTIQHSVESIRTASNRATQPLLKRSYPIRLHCFKVGSLALKMDARQATASARENTSSNAG